MTMRRKISHRAAVAWLWRLLQSRKLSLVLLVVVVLAVVLASVVPQSQVNPETYTIWKAANPLLSRILDMLLLTRIYSSWWFYVAVALLVVNTLACTLTRVFTLIRQRSRWPKLDETQLLRQTPNHDIMETSLTTREVTVAVENELQRRGYNSVIEDTEEGSYIYAHKGDLAQWGSILFHFSLVVILLAMVFVQVSRSVGKMVITEGQTVTERHEDYLWMDRPSLLGLEHQDFQVRLERFTPEYHQGNIGTDYVADLVIFEENGYRQRQRVRVNEPATYKGVRFLLEKYGFAPLFRLEDMEGTSHFEGYVNLAVIPPGTRDFFTIPHTSLTVSTALYPDMVMVEGKPTSSSLLPDNPVLYLEIEDDGEEVFQGFLPLESSVVLGKNSLTFAGLRYWTQYQVVRDPGKEFVFGGLWLGLLGLVVRYLFTPKQIWAIIRELPNGARLTLGGRAPQQDSLYGEEFASLVMGLRKEISDDPS